MDPIKIPKDTTFETLFTVGLASKKDSTFSKAVGVALKATSWLFKAVGDTILSKQFKEKAGQIVWLQRREAPISLNLPQTTKSHSTLTGTQVVSKTLDVAQKYFDEGAKKLSSTAKELRLINPHAKALGFGKESAALLGSTLEGADFHRQTAKTLKALQFLQKKKKFKSYQDRRDYYLKFTKSIINMATVVLGHINQLPTTAPTFILGVAKQLPAFPITDYLRNLLPYSAIPLLRKGEIFLRNPQIGFFLSLISNSIGIAQVLLQSQKPEVVLKSLQRSLQNETVEIAFNKLKENALFCMTDQIRFALKKKSTASELIKQARRAILQIKQADNVFNLSKVFHNTIKEFTGLLEVNGLKQPVELEHAFNAVEEECICLSSLESLREESVKTQLEEVLNKEVDIFSPGEVLSTAQRKKADQLILQFSRSPLGQAPLIQAYPMKQRAKLFRQADRLSVARKEELLQQSIGVKDSFNTLHSKILYVLKDYPKEITDQLKKANNFYQLNLSLSNIPLNLFTSQKKKKDLEKISDLASLCRKFGEMDDLREQSALKDLQKMARSKKHPKARTKIQQLIDKLSENEFLSSSIQQRENVFKKIAGLY